jgi:Cof subfamily protein (haloacid dehalogenase superfamily)
MGSCDGIYLYCDLDGTLLDDQKRVSDENIAAIRSFIERGGMFGVATGRIPGLLGAVEHRVAINAPCILYNGAGLYDLSERRFLAIHPIDRSACTHIVKRAVRFQKSACVQIFTDSAIYETNPNQADDPQTVFEHIPVTKSPIEQVPDIFMKFMISQRPERLSRLIKLLNTPRVRAEFSMFRTSERYLEFVKKGVNKGAALADVRSRCKNVKKILAIGDFENDMEMIALADIGCAPANAIDSVKQSADVVLPVDNNHSAVAHFLKAVL